MKLRQITGNLVQEIAVVLCGSHRRKSLKISKFFIDILYSVCINKGKACL
ncbi:hypothetical protein [Clostridium butyricum]|nr:hypothetical protein [Clostridium butyricum]